MDTSLNDVLICRVCFQEGIPDQPLYHPCLCTGSIKYIHQKCLFVWMKFSNTARCALCKHNYSFIPVYAPDMPTKLSIVDVAIDISFSLLSGLKHGLHSIIVITLWLFILPIVLFRVCLCLFHCSFDAVMSLSIDIWSPMSMLSDLFCGLLILIVGSFFLLLQPLQDQIYEYSPDWLTKYRPTNQIKDDIHSFNDDYPDEELNEEDFQENEDGNNLNTFDQNQGHNESLKAFFGLDGSFTFLTTYFSGGILIIILMLLCVIMPYKLGHLAINAMNVQDKLSSLYFESFATIIYGYCIIGICLSIMFTVGTYIMSRSVQHRIGFLYINVKVFPLIVVKFILIPCVFGWWLDLCSVTMFDTNSNYQLERFHMAPYTSSIIHWLLGIVFLSYFTFFVELIQEVIRFDVSRIFQIQNHGHFYLQKCIKESMLKIGLNIIVEVVLLGSVIFFIVWIPLKILKFIWPSFLPCYVMLDDDLNYFLYVVKLLFLLHAYALLHKLQNVRISDLNKIKKGIRLWFITVSNLLGIRSYLLRDEQQSSSLMMMTVDVMPNYFIIRMITLSILAALSVIVCSLSVIIIPVLSFDLIEFWWFTSIQVGMKLSLMPKINKLCNLLWGLAIILWSVKGVHFIFRPEIQFLIKNQVKFWISICSKIIVAFIVLISFLTSVLFLRNPLLVPLFVENQSLIFLISRRLYLLLMPVIILFIALMIIMKVMRVYKLLYIHVKNHKYCVGKALTNYNHSNTIFLQNN